MDRFEPRRPPTGLGFRLGLLAALLPTVFAGCGASGALPAAAPAAVRPDGGFLTALLCARCHSRSPTANALTTALGDDASPHGLWQATAMANSFRDPYWRAQMAREIEARPDDKAQIESLCLTCHAPMNSHAARLSGEPLPPMEQLASDPLALDGVSCTVCHRIQPDGLGTEKSFSGRVTILEDRRIFGPYPHPTPGPMRMNTGYTPTEGPHLSRSALCGACHTLHTSHAAGAEPFLEQATYLEWRNSEFSDEAGASEHSRTCQACHMPDMGTMKIARMPTGDDFNIAIRDGVRGHLFTGGNAWLLDLLRMNREELGVQADEGSLRRAAAAARAQLAFSAARLSIENKVRGQESLEFELAVENLTGHKLPSGYPARRAWLQVEVRGAGRVLFRSGAFDAQGRLQGIADEFAIPHTDVVEQEGQVVVYEMVALDAEGGRTTSLAAMAARGKDTRLLPRGWRADGPDAEATAPLGVLGDPNFTAGGDRVRYRVRLPAEAAGRLTIVAWLRYQPMPPAWVDGVRGSNTPEAQRFTRMYDAASFTPETIALAISGVD
jgi:hypothetical protein